MSADASLLRFDGRVAIVTGAARGLGRAYAVLLAQRGARVLVNDFEVDVRGEARSSSPAAELVDAIRQAGGSAAANFDSVTQGERIASAALVAFGRIDILVNNAGILRDRAFHNMTDLEWNGVLDVHLNGAFKTTRAAWPRLREQRYGRIVFITSAAALWGNFGQGNYCAAKAGVIGLAAALAQEGLEFNIRVNCVSPSAASRMAEGTTPPQNLSRMSPDLVAPTVAFLCHESVPVSGGVFEVGVGYVGEVRHHRSCGVNLGVQGHSPETIRDRWDDLTDFSKPTAPRTRDEVLAPFNRNLPAPMVDAGRARGPKPRSR